MRQPRPPPPTRAGRYTQHALRPTPNDDGYAELGADTAVATVAAAEINMVVTDTMSSNLSRNPMRGRSMISSSFTQTPSMPPLTRCSVVLLLLIASTGAQAGGRSSACNTFLVTLCGQVGLRAHPPVCAEAARPQ